MQKTTRLLLQISKAGNFHVEGRNMGWQKRNGHKDLKGVKSGEDFFASVMPKSDWACEVYFDEAKKILALHCSHHDAPTGELYMVHALRSEIRYF